jgi:hypothetical protein
MNLKLLVPKEGRGLGMNHAISFNTVRISGTGDIDLE